MPADAQKVHIIGISDDGLDGLTRSARKLMDDAELLVVSEPALAAALPSDGRRIEVASQPDEIVSRLDTCKDERVVILATGDPLFYGTARYLCDRLGKDRFEVVPHVSSMQLAFARVKESWDEAYLTNLATQRLDRIVERIRTAEKVGLFTTDETPPAAIARTLLDRRIDYFTAYVCENLGSPDERVTHAELADVAGQSFSPLNVLILVRKPGTPDRPPEMAGRRRFGNADERFLQSQPKRGLLTPAEVRSIALAEMDLGLSSVVWDVGAGSGAVAIEAAQLATQGTVYAIEMDPEDHQLILANAEQFGVANLTAVLGKAPEAWSDLPDPDAVFVDGTGRSVKTIVELAWDRLRSGGRIVANVGSLENAVSVRAAMVERSEDANIWMINVARGTAQMENVRFEAVNPSFLMGAVKN